MGPNPDRSAAKIVGDALHRVGYGEDSIEELLGDDAWTTALDDVPVHARRLPNDPLANMIRLFFLELPLARADAEAALGGDAVAALAVTGLASVDDTVVPRSRIAPVAAGILLASDRLSTNPEDDPPDYVSTYTPTARLCDLLTPRPRVERALDVGTGNGVHAVLAARHSALVVATDVNERALTYTQLNAALSGFDNVECRKGSLFEPVEGEQFDLITCNAPYVVSPERRWVYRDGMLEGDELSQRVVLDAAAHLRDGGFASLGVSWFGTDEDDPDERVRSWVEQAGCLGWILPNDEATPLEHAERWNSHLADRPEIYGETLDRWIAYLRQIGAAVVTEGIVLLHRAGSAASLRVDEIDEDELDIADEQIRRAFAARARLNGANLLDAKLAPVDALHVETKSRRGRVVGASVVLEEGTWPRFETSARAAQIVGSLDGHRTLRELDASKEAIQLCRDLLELGAVQLNGFASAQAAAASARRTDRSS
jgi:methylase of polypeptide subunit release factors